MGIVILAIVLVLVWIVLSARIRRLEEQAERDAKAREGESEIVAGLLRRVYTLEKAHSAPPSVAQPAPVIDKPIPAATEAPIATSAPIPQLAAANPSPTVKQFTPARAIAQPELPQETLRGRLRRKMGDAEWEAVVGGSWLNKVGVLVLVIGIALLVGYEFARAGPVGRVGKPHP